MLVFVCIRENVEINQLGNPIANLQDLSQPKLEVKRATSTYIRNINRRILRLFNNEMSGQVIKTRARTLSQLY